MPSVRDLLKIEKALHSKLDSAWQLLAAHIWSRVKDCLERKDFAGAHHAAAEMDLKHIAEVNRDWVKHYLLQAAVYGGAMANKGKKSPTVASGAYEHRMDKVANTFIVQMERNVTEAAYTKLVQLIADAEKAEKESVQKADGDRYVEEFQTFSNAGSERMKLISSLHTSRLAAWGGIAECQTLGAAKYRIVEQEDDRCCAFCESMNGTEFDVDTGDERIQEILDADPDDLEDVAPFGSTDKATLAKIADADPEELQEMGYDVPPFHPGCRGTIEPVFDDEADDEDEEGLGGALGIALDAFEYIGAKAEAEEVAAWNESIRAKPVEVLEDLTGLTEKQLIEKPLGEQKFFDFAADGSLKMKVEGQIDGVEAKLNMVYDPLVGKLYQNYAEFQAEPDRAAEWISGVLNRAKSMGETLGAKQFVVGASGDAGVLSYAKMGFTPASEAEWLDLQLAIEKDIKPGGALADLFAHDPEKMKLVMALLDSKDPKALWSLAALPEGPQLLNGRSLNMALDLADHEATSLFDQVSR